MMIKKMIVKAGVPQIKEGDFVEIETYQKDGFDNFKVPSETDKLWKAINDILMRLVRVEAEIRNHNSEPYPPHTSGHVEEQDREEIDPNNLPF